MQDHPPTRQVSRKQGSLCGPTEKSREELNLTTMVAKELDLSTFHHMFGLDVRGRHVKSARVRHHVGITCADVVPVENVLKTPPVFLGGRSSTWNPLGGTAERTCIVYCFVLYCSVTNCQLT